MALAAAAIVAALLQEPVVPPTPPAELSICEVLADWRDHHGKTVRVRGRYASGFEISSLSGAGCRERAWVSAGDGSEPGLMAKIRRRGSGSRFFGVPVVLEGIFHGPAPRADGAPARYGHLGGYAGWLEITKVHSVGKGEPRK